MRKRIIRVNILHNSLSELLRENKFFVEFRNISKYKA